MIVYGYASLINIWVAFYCLKWIFLYNIFMSENGCSKGNYYVKLHICFVFMYVCIMYVCIYVLYYVCLSICGYVHVSSGTQRSQKRALAYLDLELQAVVTHLIWVLNLILCKSSTCYWYMSQLSSHYTYIFWHSAKCVSTILLTNNVRILPSLSLTLHLCHVVVWEIT